MWEFVALISSLLTRTLVCADLRAGLEKHVIFHYDFEGNSNTSVMDVSGNRNNATSRMNKPFTRNHTECGQGIALNKTSLEIRLNKTWSNYTDNATSWHPGLTIAVWVWMGNLNHHHTVFNSYNENKVSKDNRFFHFGIAKNGGVQWLMKALPGKKRTFKLKCNRIYLNEKQWYHVAVTYERSQENNTAMFFVNGMTHENCSKHFSTRPKPKNMPRLGWHPEIGSRNHSKYFKGIMDDYYIFNKALNQTELAEVMKCNRGSAIELKPAPTTEANPTSTVFGTETTLTTEVKETSTLQQLPSTTKTKPTTFVSTKEATLTTEVKKTSTLHQSPPIITKINPTTTVSATMETVSATMETVSATMETVSATMETVSTTMETVSTTMETVSTTMETVSTTMETVSTTMETVSATMETVSTTMETVSTTMETVSTTMETVSTTMETVSTTMEQHSILETPIGGADEEELMGNTIALENIGIKLARSDLNVSQSLTVVTKSALITIYIPTSAFTFPSAKELGSQKINETIKFPDEIIDTESELPRAVVCLLYTDLHKKMNQSIILSSSFVKSEGALQLNSKIIGAAVDPPLLKPLKHPIEVAFSHEPVAQGRQICSFWNHSIITSDGKQGQWSTQGCELDERRTTPTRTVCLCNHLTNFALLLQREGVEYSDPPLSLQIITIVGCSFSILACVLCFIMFLTLKKKDIRHYLHINLSVAIAVSQTILLFGITKTKYKVLCKVFAISLHYFYLVAFVLMLSESVHLAILIESAFSYGDLKLPMYLITSWGLPFLIVGITLAARFDNYGGEKACFISAKKGTVYAFVGPFGLVLVINFVILIIVLRQVVKKTSLPISSKAASRFEIARATIRSLVILFPVMGFTWLFGILFFAFRTLTLEYLFGIFCSFQGFFIFLFQFVLNTENRSAFLRATQRWRTSTFSSRNESSVRGQSNSQHTSEVKNEELKNSKAENCHLLVYRKVDGETMSTHV